VVYLHIYAEQGAGLIHAYHLRLLRFVNDAFIKVKSLSKIEILANFTHELFICAFLNMFSYLCH